MNLGNLTDDTEVSPIRDYEFRNLTSEDVVDGAPLME